MPGDTKPVLYVVVRRGAGPVCALLRKQCVPASSNPASGVLRRRLGGEKEDKGGGIGGHWIQECKIITGFGFEEVLFRALRSPMTEMTIS